MTFRALQAWGKGLFRLLAFRFRWFMSLSLWAPKRSGSGTLLFGRKESLLQVISTALKRSVVCMCLCCQCVCVCLLARLLACLFADLDIYIYIYIYIHIRVCVYI